MIKKIYHLADLHTPITKGLDMYEEIYQKITQSIKEQDQDIPVSEKIVCILGDLVHNKTVISNSQILLLSQFLRALCDIEDKSGKMKVIIVAGNHDMMANNDSKLDSITPIVEMMKLPNLIYLDKEFGYKSGSKTIDNITFHLFSIFDDYKRPDIENERILHPQNTHIGLFHGAIIGSSTDLGFTMSHGEMAEGFFGLDLCIMGDIHLPQELTCIDGDKKIKLVYSGSPLQNNYGENVRNHGYIIWDIETNTYEKINIETEYGYFKFEVSSVDDIKEDKEILCNLG